MFSKTAPIAVYFFTAYRSIVDICTITRTLTFCYIFCYIMGFGIPLILYVRICFGAIAK
jgi:hypothetical protein